MRTFKEVLKVLGLLIFCVGLPVIGWALLRIAWGVPSATAPNPTNAELVSIVLTAVTVVLAVLAIIIAILAVWGYRSIKEEAAGAAERAVKSTVEVVVGKHVGDDRVKAMVKKELARLTGEILAESSDYTGAFPSSADSGQQEPIAGEYPKGDGTEG